MTTQLTIMLPSDEGQQPRQIYVDEDFDEALEKVHPVTPPTSSLQARENDTWHVDGKRVYIGPGVALLHEDQEME